MLSIIRSFELAKRAAWRNGFDFSNLVLTFNEKNPFMGMCYVVGTNVVWYGICNKDEDVEEQIATCLHEFWHSVHSSDDSLEDEFACDAFAAKCGYANGLITMLLREHSAKVRGARNEYADLLAVCPETSGTFEEFFGQFFECMTHPSDFERISRLEKLWK